MSQPKDGRRTVKKTQVRGGGVRAYREGAWVPVIGAKAHGRVVTGVIDGPHGDPIVLGYDCVESNKFACTPARWRWWAKYGGEGE
jgi:hypothetical protein